MKFYKKEEDKIIFDFIFFRIKFGLKNNKLIINNKKYSEKHKVRGLKLSFEGRKSEVIIDKDLKFEKCHFIIKNNVKIHIKKSPYIIEHLNISTTNNVNVYIDEDFSCHGLKMELHDEPYKTIKIGKDCMFSWGIAIRNSDGHSIYDMRQKKLLNLGSDITIGDHVWVGQRVNIIKHSNIPSNSIVGINSLVNKKFEEQNIIIAGIPAKIIKRNIFWDRKPPKENLKTLRT